MVQLTESLAELRAHIVRGEPLHGALCRRLLLKAARGIPDLERAARLVDQAGLLIETIDLAAVMGTDRQVQIDQIMDLLSEIEQLGGTT